MHFGNLALTWQSAYAAVHDRVTNGSKMLQTQQYSLVYNTKFDDKWALIHTFWGHRLQFSVGSSTTVLTRRRQREDKGGKNESKERKTKEKKRQRLQQSWAFLRVLQQQDI